LSWEPSRAFRFRQLTEMLPGAGGRAVLNIDPKTLHPKTLDPKTL